MSHCGGVVSLLREMPGGRAVYNPSSASGEVTVYGEPDRQRGLNVRLKPPARTPSDAVTACDGPVGPHSSSMLPLCEGTPKGPAVFACERLKRYEGVPSIRPDRGERSAWMVKLCPRDEASPTVSMMLAQRSS